MREKRDRTLDIEATKSARGRQSHHSIRLWDEILALIPQEIVLSISAAGALKAMWTGSFADGVLRSNVFIAADQVYSVILAIGHALAIIFHARYTIK